MFGLHRLFELPGNNPLDRGRFDFVVNTFFLQKLIKGRTDATFFTNGQVSISFSLLRENATSSAGVCCVFFMKPCSSTISLRTIAKITRAIRLLRNVLRTSHRPCPNGRHVGIPTGHPYSTVAISAPIVDGLRHQTPSATLEPDAVRLRSGKMPPEFS